MNSTLKDAYSQAIIQINENVEKINFQTSE